MEEHVSTNEAADILGVSRQQVLKYIHSGRLASVQYETRGRHRIKHSDVLALKNGK